MWYVHCGMITDSCKENHKSAYFQITLRNVLISVHYFTVEFEVRNSSVY